MARAALILVLPVVFACTKKDEVPAVDTAAMATAPAPMDVAGKWSFKVMPQDRDTVLTTYVLDATNDETGWKLTFPGRDPLDVRVLSVSPDSIVTETGPYPSAVQKGVKVNMVHTNMHMEGDKLVGTAIAHYDKKTADSVVTLRQEGIRQ
jgi:hypothetical protein